MLNPSSLVLVTLPSAIATLAVTALQVLAATPEQVCEASKNLIAGKYAACRSKAEKVYVLSGDLLRYDALLLKCESKFAEKWASAEGPGACPTEGDEGDVQGVVDECGVTIAGMVAGSGPSGCGNGDTELLEDCDDGNVVNGDACNPTCTFTNTTSLVAGLAGMSGSTDGTGSAARFGAGGGVAGDGTYLYVADTQNHRIRRIEIATGIVTTIAGSTLGYADNATGTNAQFNAPEGLATDGTTLWVGDVSNEVIRAINLTAPFAVTTVAGTANMVGTADGVGAAAGFDSVRGLTRYNGLIYLLDANAATLRSFDPSSGSVVTLAGSPYMTAYMDGIGAAARFISPRFMTSSGSGLLYVADTNGSAIRAFDTATNAVTTLAGNGVQGYVDGASGVARVHRPRGIATDGTSVYWAESEQDTVRQVVLATGDVSTMVGSHCGGAACPGGYVEGVGTAALLSNPLGMTYDAGSDALYLFDSGNFVVRRVQ